MNLFIYFAGQRNPSKRKVVEKKQRNNLSVRKFRTRRKKVLVSVVSNTVQRKAVKEERRNQHPSLISSAFIILNNWRLLRQVQHMKEPQNRAAIRKDPPPPIDVHPSIHCQPKSGNAGHQEVHHLQGNVKRHQVNPNSPISLPLQRPLWARVVIVISESDERPVEKNLPCPRKGPLEENPKDRKKPN